MAHTLLVRPLQESVQTRHILDVPERVIVTGWRAIGGSHLDRHGLVKHVQALAREGIENRGVLCAERLQVAT